MEITTERLQTLFRPKRMALVGASDKNAFSRALFANLERYDQLDRLVLVNRRGVVTHGVPTVTDCRQIDEPVDVAFMMVPREGMIEALSNVHEAGIQNAIVLSSGYGESGPVGSRAEVELVEHARSLDMLVLGPNMVGFANFVDRIPAMSTPVQAAEPGPLGLISQSGASALAMAEFSLMCGVGLSYSVTLGNEAIISAAHVLSFLVDDESTSAVAMFIETIRDPEVFRTAALRAAGLGKPIVALKVGSSELSARTAAAHTGAIVGDDRVIDAVLRELAIIRVDTIEDMMLTAGAAAHVGRMKRPGVGVVSISGGACDIVADRAADVGLPLPELAPHTVATIGEFASSFGSVQNPLDVTGAALADLPLFTKAITAVAADPQVGAVAVVYSLPWQRPAGPELPWNGAQAARAIGDGIAAASAPTIVVNQVLQPNSAYTQGLMKDAGIPFVLPGLKQAVFALAQIGMWSHRLDVMESEPTHSPLTLPIPVRAERRGQWSESATREMLAAAGIPSVPASVVRSADEAVAAALIIGGPVAVKIVSADILHKSDIGGVRLGVEGDVQVRHAYSSVIDAGQSVAGADIAGVLIAPMRTPAVELLVGVVRDPQWGLVIAVGFGGVLVEILDDSVLSALPISPRAAGRMLRRLRGAPILDGIRGTTPTDKEALAGIISRVGDLAVALGDDLLSLEINPLRVDGSQIEALDAAVEWVDQS